jgi:hypothetical protein
VKEALRDARRDIGTNDLPDLKKIELTLTTETVRTINGEVKILVKLAGSTEHTTSQELTFELAPPAVQGPVGAGTDVYESLKRAIVGAAAGAKQARTAGGPDLEVEAVSVVIGFEVVRAKEAGLELEISSLSVGGGAQQSRKRGHTITVSFEKS